MINKNTSNPPASGSTANTQNNFRSNQLTETNFISAGGV